MRVHNNAYYMCDRQRRVPSVEPNPTDAGSVGSTRTVVVMRTAQAAECVRRRQRHAGGSRRGAAASGRAGLHRPSSAERPLAALLAQVVPSNDAPRARAASRTDAACVY